jgi:hypothetical protein
VLEPVVAHYRGRVKRLYFRGDAAFASPEIYEFLEAEGMGYAIRLPANRVLQDKIGHLLKRPAGRPPQEVRRYYSSFSYRAGSWTKPRRVVAKVEWHPGELYPRVGFIVTNLARPAERVVAFYNHRATAEQWLSKWPRSRFRDGCACNRRRTAFAAKERHDRRVHLIVPLPSLIGSATIEFRCDAPRSDEARSRNASTSCDRSKTMADLDITPYWITHDHRRAVQVWRIQHRSSGFNALAYVCSLEEDFDGAPRCYGEPNPGRFGATVNAESNPDTALQADIRSRLPHRPPDRADPRATLDHLGNATSPYQNFGVNTEFAWVGLTSMAPSEVQRIPNPDPRRPPINVPSLDMRPGLGARYRKNAHGDFVIGPHGEHFFPVIQGPNAPAPGFFVSTTALARDPSRPETDPNHFFDATAIPYQAFNGWMWSAGAAHVNKGDLGLVIDPVNGVTSGFVLADAGAGNKAGEVSTYLLSLLGGNNERDFLFLLFPGSGHGGTLLTGTFPLASSAGAMANLPKLNVDDDAAIQLILFLALGTDLDKFNKVNAGDLSRDVMIDAQEAYQDMRRLLVPYGIDAAATLGVE